MTDQSLPGLEHVRLEDSYFLGIVARGRCLSLRVLLALLPGHPAYTCPLPGDFHCYREGDILLGGFGLIDWKPGRRGNVLIDPDGTIDLGSIHLVGSGSAYVAVTEWFEMRFKASSLTVELDPSL